MKARARCKANVKSGMASHEKRDGNWTLKGEVK